MKTEKKKLPIGFWACSTTEIFERFAYYLGRSILLVFVAAIVCDRLIGARYTTPIGMLLCGVGYWIGFLRD